MEKFQTGWTELDSGRKGFVRTNDMVAWMKRTGFDDENRTKWIALFDKNNSGTIELATFCDVVGLNPKRVYELPKEIEAWRQAWLAVDKDRSGVVTRGEMEDYMQREGYDDSMMSKWFRKFDKDGSGRIDLEEFCKELGISPELIYQTLPEGVQFISGSMSIDWQIRVADLCLEGIRSQQSMKKVPEWLKLQADGRFGKVWHFVVVNGQFWCYYGFEPGYSFVFRYGKYVFLVFKTPLL